MTEEIHPVMEGKARANGVGTRASPRVWEGGIVHIVLLVCLCWCMVGACLHAIEVRHIYQYLTLPNLNSSFWPHSYRG